MRTPSCWLKPLLFCLSLLPLLGLLYGAARGMLGVNPVESLHHSLGDWTLRFLLFTLLITPLRLIPGLHWLAHVRRMLGLFAFFYATLHLLVYLIIDQGLDWVAIGEELVERPYITLGMCAYLLLIPLAVTSNQQLIRIMGGYWQKLHRLIYLITTLGILHFYLLVKADKLEPLLYLALLGVLVVLRLLLHGTRAGKAKAGVLPRTHSESGSGKHFS